MAATVTTYVGREQIFTIAGQGGDYATAKAMGIAFAPLTATPNFAVGTPVAFFMEHEGNNRLFYTDDLVGSGLAAAAELPVVRSLAVQTDPQGQASGRVVLTLTMPSGSPDAASPQTYYLNSRNLVIGTVASGASL